jgi:hypothetical protein
MADSILCNDANGLALFSNGDVSQSVSGLFTSLIQVLLIFPLNHELVLNLAFRSLKLSL